MYIFQFSKLCMLGKKYLKDSQRNNLNLAQKYAQVLVLVKAHSLSQATLYTLRNCLLPGTDIVNGQIFKYTFVANVCYCLYMYVIVYTCMLYLLVYNNCFFCWCFRPRESRGGPTVLILSPTRELALQIEAEVKKFHYRGIRRLVVEVLL